MSALHCSSTSSATCSSLNLVGPIGIRSPRPPGGGRGRPTSGPGPRDLDLSMSKHTFKINHTELRQARPRPVTPTAPRGTPFRSEKKAGRRRPLSPSSGPSRALASCTFSGARCPPTAQRRRARYRQCYSTTIPIWTMCRCSSGEPFSCISTQRAPPTRESYHGCRLRSARPAASFNMAKMRRPPHVLVPAPHTARRDAPDRPQPPTEPPAYSQTASAMRTALRAAPRSSWSPHTKKSRPFSPKTSFLRMRPTSTSYFLEAVSGIG